MTTCFLRGGDYERGGNVSRANGAILDEYLGETREIIWSHRTRDILELYREIKG